MRHATAFRALVSLAAAGMLWGCGSSGSPAPERSSSSASADPLAELEGLKAAPAGQDSAPVDQPLDINAQDEQWRKIAEEAFRKYGLQDQERIAQSQEWYRQAVAWRDKADFQKAREMAQKAAQTWPENLDAKRLLAEVNALIVGGRENFGQQSMAEKAKEEWGVKLEQAQIEITNHIRNGERFYNIRQYDDAIRELDNATFKIKNIPFEVPAMKALEQPVDELLRRVRDAKILEESRVKELKRAEAEAEMSAHEAARRREVIEKIAHLLELCYMAFDQRKFDNVLRMCNEILMIDPHYTVAAELKEDATKARHRQEYYDSLKMKIENWKQLTAADDEVVIPYSQTVRFPTSEEWGEISKRITHETLKGQEGGGPEDDPDILSINRKLESMRIEMGFEDAKFDNILAYIQEYSGLNFLVDQGVREKVDLEKPITFKVKDLVLRNVLKILLQQFALDYTITEEKIVFITTPDLAGGKPVLELHDVRDILVRIQDFGGPKVELVPPTGGAGGAPLTGASFSVEEPKESSVSQDQILELIKENIAPGSWEGEYTISLTPNQQLMVNHTRKAHRELREFLQKLRSYTGTMVGITARFLSAYDDFLDDVGVDIINRPPASGFDVPGRGFTSIDDPSGEIGPGFVTVESARLERYDLRAQTFHTMLLPSTTPGTFVDPLSNRLINQGGLGLQYQWIGEQALQTVLRALHKSQKATVVQAPRVTVFNTQRSHIMSITQSAYVADLEPQVTTYAAGYDPVIGVLTEGIVLDVRPIVSHDRKYVMLELRPSLAELQAMRTIDIETGNPVPPGTTTAFTLLQLPWIVLQKAETTVTIPDRGTLLVSGFKDIIMKDFRSGVPYLENIPLLNFFFTRKGQSNEKRRLMILVTPEIIDLAEHEGRSF